MQDRIDKLNMLKKSIELLDQKKREREIRLGILRTDRDKILEEIRKLGVDPKKLSEEIQRLETEIDERLQEIESKIPPEHLSVHVKK